MLNKLYNKLIHQVPLIVLTLFITLAFLLQKTDLYDWPVLNDAENFLYDLRIIATMPRDVDERIVIVDIDEKSLAEVGRWPWSRNNVSRLVDELFDYYNVTLVGFDIVFPEPDESSGLKILKVLGRNELADIEEYQNVVAGLEDQLDYDKQLANSISNNKVILGYYFKYGQSSVDSTNSGVLPEPAFHKDIFKDKNVLARQASGYGGNIQILQQAALGGGHFSPWLDEDGVIRRVPMIYEYQDNYYETLSLVMVRTLFDIEKTLPVFEITESSNYPALESLSLDFLDVPVDKNLQALVPYRGYQGSFPYISASDVIYGRVDKDLLKEAIVLVGTTAPGLFDLRTTPVQKQYAGVEVHANLISGILDQNIKLRPAYVEGAEFIQLLLTGCLLTLLLPLLSPLWATTATVIVSTLIVGINIFFWQYGNLVMPLASSLMLILIIFITHMSYGFFIERRGKLQIASIFGQYIPSDLIDEMNFNPDSYTLEAENREMTVLFSDIRGFTTISEGLTPAQLSQLINAYLTPMTKIIHENRGTIDKYIGDAVMAFWGAPIENPQHARHALESALAMLERLSALQEEFAEKGWPPVKIGIGLNTGVMSVGNMGSEFRLSYTVMGDPVNLGSRLEGLTKSYGVELIVSETTKNAVPEYSYRELDFVRVKGKEKPIAIFEPVSLEEEISNEEQDEINLWDKALDTYRNQEWSDAEKQLQYLKSLSPERMLYDIYLERIASFMEDSPGKNWDGVFIHKTK